MSYHHMLAHGQQSVVQSRVGALFVAALLGHQVVDVSAVLLQHCHIPGVPVLTLQLVHLSEFAAELKINPSTHGEVSTDRVHQSVVLRRTEQIAPGLRNLTLGRSQLWME